MIGLTGGIASGKSSVAASLQGLGAVVIECDKLGNLAKKYMYVIVNKCELIARIADKSVICLPPVVACFLHAKTT